VPADLLQIVAFTTATALAATALMLPLGLPIAYALARGRFRGRLLLETVVSLPLVMPPVATGLVLLMLCAPAGPLGGLLARLGIEIVFTWKAVVLAMAVMGLPLFVRTARAGFEQVDARFESVAATLGAAPLRVFFSITVPLAAPGVLAGAVLGFARALGEFGATITIAGSIPGATRTLSSAIYTFAETGRDGDAGVLIATSAAIAFAALFVSNRLAARAGLRA
jgi:molybdate transport system permease protein